MTETVVERLMSAELSVPELDADIDPLTAALAYADAGCYVLPVKAGSKHPGSVVVNDWHTLSSREPKQIAAWFVGTDYGIALHVGRSGLLAVDVDAPGKLHPLLRQAIDETSPPFQSTRADEPGRGHYLFRQPPGRTLGNSTGKLGDGWGEMRGKNGVIILAPSVHADAGDGARYLCQRVGPVPVLPAYVADELPDAEDACDAASDATVAAFLAEHTAAGRPELLDGLLRAFTRKVEAGESRHQAAVTAVVGAMKEARAGYYDAVTAADTLQAAFLDAVAAPPIGGKQGRPRTGGVARSEWAGISRGRLLRRTPPTWPTFVRG